MKQTSLNLVELMERFANEDKARVCFEKLRWPDGAACPRCGAPDPYQLKPTADGKTHVRKGVWKCSRCRKQFTVTIGTIMEDSHIPLHKWLIAFHLLCASKKGMSAHQLHRMLGLGYRAAWFMAHRIRYAMTQQPMLTKLFGIIEVDETYIGGKTKTGSQAVKPCERAKDHLSPVHNKAAVVSLVQRGGNVHSRHIDRVTAENLRPVIDEMVDAKAHIMTDSSTTLQGATMGMKHDQVNHSAGEYVRQEGETTITTNSVESYFAILKRGIHGVYHHVSKMHLHRYLSEFDFRYNARDVEDGVRTLLAIKGITGKRLKYQG